MRGSLTSWRDGIDEALVIVLADLLAACGANPSFLCELVFDASGSETLAQTADFIVRPLKVVLIFVGAWILNRIVRRAIRHMTDRVLATQEAKAQAAGERADTSFLQELGLDRVERLTLQAERGRQRAHTLGAVLRSAAVILIYGTATVMALGEFNVSLGPLIASAGIVGVALGFGAQSLVRDFLSGTFMLLEDQYGVGDIVDVGDAVGVVEEVNLRTTQIRDVNGTLWFVPNGEIRRVANKSQEWARAVIDVDVAYDTDLDLAASVIKRAADTVWEEDLDRATILEEPQVLGIETFGPDAVSIRLIVKVEPAEQFAVAREIRRRLKDAFDEHGISIPFPQRTVWMHHVNEPAD